MISFWEGTVTAPTLIGLASYLTGFMNGGDTTGIWIS